MSFRSIYDRVRCEGFIAGSGNRGYEVNVRGMMKRIRRKFWAVDPAFGRIGTVMATGYYWGPMSGEDGISDAERQGLSGRCRSCN